MQPFTTYLLPAIPLLPLLAGLAIRNLTPIQSGKIAQAAAGFSTALAAAAAVVLFSGESHSAGFPLRLDGIAVVMVALVSFLGTMVIRFSKNYLAGDPHQSRFFSWMSLTLASVLTIVLSSNLLLLSVAWISSSLCLHRLLLHYPERAGAIFSARKKFVFSRLGDACLISAIVILFSNFHTWDLDTLFAAIAAGKSEGLPAAGLLFAACAVLKSAQFPFHSWLPDTMETPTPVSAFMHAGIVNAGGFLIVRMSPIFVHAPSALNSLAVIGAVTAGFGGIVMLAQPSVKRALAYSTIAQMGFMILQCGLGAYGLALLHIAAHSLYKAHAFLTAGSTIGAVPRAAIVLKTPALTLGILVAGMIIAAGATLLHLLTPAAPPHFGVFGLILALAIAYGLARAWSVGGGASTAVRAVAAALGIACASLGLHAAASSLFAKLPAASPAPAVMVFVIAVFAALFIFQALLWRAARYSLGRRLYVHALNGFYFGTLANRLLGRLWPRHPIA